MRVTVIAGSWTAKVSSLWAAAAQRSALHCVASSSKNPFTPHTGHEDSLTRTGSGFGEGITNGNYLFVNLPVNGADDPYRVTVTSPASFPAQTYDASPSVTDDVSTLNVVPGSTNLLQDFGYRGTATLGNQVWHDLNRNGRQDGGEPGINGVSVQLFYAGPDGVFQAGELVTPLLTTTTAGGGLYQFANLAAGTYRVRFGDTAGGAASTTNPVTVSTTSGVNRIDIDFGFRGTSSLGDRVYFDQDSDGVQDIGEQGLPGVTVTLLLSGFDGVFGNGDDITLSTLTNASGNYLFPNLPAGSYRVSVPTPGSGGVSGDFVLIDSIDNGVLSPNASPTVTLGAGQNRTDVDFGFGNSGLIIGADLGCNHGSLVQVVDPGNGSIRAQRYVYEPTFRGGVRVYGADITGDGIPEILTAPGSGRPGEVRVFDRDLNPLPQYNFFPFGTAYNRGVEIAAGSVTGPGTFQIVAAQSGGSSLVRVFQVNPGSGVNSTPLRQFQPFGPKFTGGVTVATADVGTFAGAAATSAAPDGVSEIIGGSGAGLPAEVRVYNARPATPALINAFRVLGGTLRGMTLSRLPGAGGASDRIIVAGGQRNAGQVETWARVGSGFSRTAVFTAFGGTTSAVSAAAINADNIFAVQGVGGTTSGIRKHTSPASSVSTPVPQATPLQPAWRIAILRR